MRGSIPRWEQRKFINKKNMAEIFKTNDLSKEEIINLYEKICEDLKKEYEINLIIKRENEDLKKQIKSIKKKLDDIVKFQF